jgi:hypothetical protein
MAHTLTYIRKLVTDLLDQDLDNRVGDAPTDADIDAQLNEAARKVSTDVRPIERLALAYTNNTPTVDLDAHTPRIMQVHQVQVGASTLVDHRGRRMIYTYEQLALDRPGFESGGTPGIPTAAAQLAETLYLHPAPTTGQTIRVVADVYLASMPAAGGDPVDMPKDLAEAVAYHAAVLAAEPRLHMPHQAQRLESARARADATVAKWRRHYDIQRMQMGVAV